MEVDVTLYTLRARLLATCLSALAGYVDATAFIQAGGFFVSFMSGNTTRFGVGLAAGSGQALFAAALICTFFMGVVTGSLLGSFASSRRGPAVLALVSLLLVVAAALTAAEPFWAMFPMALAMGAENAVFEKDGDVGIGLTYMTGALVKAGQRLAAALLGGERWSWVPYLLLWLGLAAGALTGALASRWLGAGGVWLAAGAAASLGFASARLGPAGHEPAPPGRPPNLIAERA